MDTIRVLAVAPYEGLSESIIQTAKTHPAISLRVCIGDLETGVSEALRLLDGENADIILSRGGTARLLRRALDIPVIDIPITVGDILQAIKLAENYRERFCIMGFANITGNGRFIRDLMKYDLEIFTVDSAGEVPGLLGKLREDGYGLVLGDMIASTLARQAGMNSLLITSGSESVEESLVLAENLYGTLEKQRQADALRRKLLTNNPTRSFILYRDGRVETEDTDIPEKDYAELRAQIKKASSAAWSRESLRVDKQMGDRLLRLSFIRKGDVMLTYASETHCPFVPENGGVTILNKSEQDHEDFNTYYGTFGTSGRVRSLIAAYNQTVQPVYIAGEKGTGKDTIAAYLYRNGLYCDEPCYQISCDKLSEKQWQWLTQNPDSPLCGAGYTVYFRNADALPPSRWEALEQIIGQTRLHRRNRLLFSSITESMNNPQREHIDAYLLNSMSCLFLGLPPLRERAEDIPSLATLYINHLNSELGRHVIGFEPDALDELCRYDWPQNLDQFRRALREFVIVSNGFYITHTQVIEFLRGEKQFSTHAVINSGYVIDLNLSLDDIVFDVVNAVLTDEKGNQKKTAERLGVSRTTVWRILKNKKEQRR